MFNSIIEEHPVKFKVNSIVQLFTITVVNTEHPDASIVDNCELLLVFIDTILLHGVVSSDVNPEYAAVTFRMELQSFRLMDDRLVLEIVKYSKKEHDVNTIEFNSIHPLVFKTVNDVHPDTFNVCRVGQVDVIRVIKFVQFDTFNVCNEV